MDDADIIRLADELAGPAARDAFGRLAGATPRSAEAAIALIRAGQWLNGGLSAEVMVLRGTEVLIALAQK